MSVSKGTYVMKHRSKLLGTDVWALGALLCNFADVTLFNSRYDQVGPTNQRYSKQFNA